jgi:hypothetical protein
MQCAVPTAGRNHFTIAAVLAVVCAAFQPATAQVNRITLNLTPQPKFVKCLGVEGGPTPTATVTVVRGELHDTLTLKASNIKPNLGFDLFTIQNSNLLADGNPNPDFANFGLAWYQTDVQGSRCDHPKERKYDWDHQGIERGSKEKYAGIDPSPLPEAQDRSRRWPAPHGEHPNQRCLRKSVALLLSALGSTVGS